ncbi:MAG: hypothetical protein ACE368_00255 [Paracoccaceae bacterium]
MKPIAVIIGVGSGLSAALARRLAPDYDLVLAARDAGKLSALAAETGGRAVAGRDRTAAVDALFDGLPAAPRGGPTWPGSRPGGRA